MENWDDLSAGSSKKRAKPVQQNIGEVENLSVDMEEDGKLVRKGIKKEVLASKGAWATVMYLFQDLDRKKGEFGAPKVSVVRYKKSNKVYLFQKEFTFGSTAQAKLFSETVLKWLDEGVLPKNSESEEE
jgi:hypothetical protein